MRVGFGKVVVLGALTAAAPALAGWDEGVAAFKSKNYPQAAREFEAVAKDRPDWAGGFLMLGRTQLLMDRSGDAVNTLRKAYDLDPSGVETQLALAQAYLGAGRASEASQLLAKINAAGLPKERQSLYQQLVAKAASDTGQTDRAASALEKAAAAAPNDATVQFNYGVLALNAGDTGKAVAALEKASRLDPADAGKQKVLVQALVRQGRETGGGQKDAIYGRAAEVARSLVAKNASYEHLLLLGETQLGSNQYDAAVATFAQASAKNAGDWLPGFYAGQAQTALGRYGEAESSLRKALQSAGATADKARIWRQLGFVYEKQKNFEQAKTAYRSGGDEGAIARVEENQRIADHNRTAEEEEKRLAELKRQQEILREQLQGAPPPPRR
ncbi:MAG: tetratricopeptide repeat protein [Thermoanaerobaculia bacterium]|nr:tetratricopeptide repeat protein [Thermoanaerobaculia bacterium]